MGGGYGWLARVGARRGLRVDSGGYGLEGLQAEGKRVLQVAAGYFQLAAVTLGGELLVGGRGAHGQLGLGDWEDVEGTMRRVWGPLAGLMARVDASTRIHSVVISPSIH